MPDKSVEIARVFLAVIVLGACSEAGAGPSGSLDARVAITVRVGRATANVGERTVEALVGYLRNPVGGGAAEDIPLGSASVGVGTESQVSIPVEIDLARCLGDEQRASTGETCPLVVSLVLRMDALVLDSIRIGPFSAIAGGVTQVPDAVVLHEVAGLSLSWTGKLPGATGDTLRAGRTLALLATPVDAGGASVPGKVVVWASSDPSIAGIDAQSGLVTPLLPGTATITASAGERVGSFSAQVYAAAEVLQLVGGDGQRIPFGGQVSSAPTVRVTDLANRPAEAVSVTFAVTAGSGQLTGSAQRTNAQGEARPGTWATGTAPAVNTLLASVAGLPAVTITAYGTIPPLVDQLAVGNLHACVIDAGGSTSCWGSRQSGSIGDGGPQTGISVRVAVAGAPAFTSIVSHGSHTCGMAAGVVSCWGRNNFSQASGNGSQAHLPAPVVVAGGPYAQFSGGRLTSCGITTTSLAVCWGLNQNGEVGDSTQTLRLTPVAVLTSLQFVSIEASWLHSCGLTSSGAAHCWGSFHGQGQGIPSLVPAPIPGGHAFTRLFSGGTSTCGLTSNGEAWCWGSNAAGQLGDGTTTSTATPVLVAGGRFFSTIATATVPNAVGRGRTCAITITGEAYCWGGNLEGGLGIGTFTNHEVVPTRVVTNEVFVAIGTGDQQTCALTPDRRVFCWGSNANGELGSGVAGGNSATPVLVP